MDAADRTRGDDDPVTQVEGELTRKARNLVIARESDPSDRHRMSLLQGMIHQTLLQYREQLNLGPYDPEAVRLEQPASRFDQLMLWGAGPARDDFQEPSLRRVAFEEGQSRGYEFRVGDNIFLYSIGSASKTDLERENGFVKHVAKRIEQLRPENVMVATFSRLIRSTEFSGTMLGALKRAESNLCAGVGQSIHFNDAMSDTIFTLFSLFSAQERSAIVTRLLHGKINKVRRGEWFTGPASIPLGFRIGTHGRLEANPDMQPHVAKVIDMLGDPRMRPAHFLANLAAIGLTPPTDSRGWGYDSGWNPGSVPYADRVIRQSVGQLTSQPSTTASADQDSDELLVEDDLVAPLRSAAGLPDPSGLMARCFRYLDLWETGELVIRQTNPLPGVRAYANLEVQRTSPGSPGFIELRYDSEELRLPDGWASAERIARAKEMRAARAENPLRGIRRFPFVGPTASFDYEESQSASVSLAEEHEYYISATSRTDSNARPASYDLMSRPVQPIGTPWGRFVNGNRPDARVEVHRLHREIVNAAIRAFRDGVPMEHVETSAQRDLIMQWELQTEEKLQELEELESGLDAILDALHAARSAGNERELVRWQRRFDRQEIKVDRCQEELQARQSGPPVPDLPIRFAAQASDLVTGLAGLAAADEPLDGDAADALAAVFHDFRLRKESELEVEFRYFLLLPTEAGGVRVGPIFGRCAKVGRVDGPSIAARGRDVARHLMTTDSDLRQLLRPGQTNGADDLVRAEAYLREIGLADWAVRAALAALPIEARREIWGMLHEAAPGASPVRADLDPAYVELIRQKYGQPEPPVGHDSKAIWFGGSLMKASIVSHLSEQGTQSRTDYLRWLDQAGFSLAGYNRYVMKQETDRADDPKFLAIAQPFGGRGRTPPETVSLMDCPHCDLVAGLALYTPVPEVPGALLCVRCLRGREPQSPVYPETYRAVSRVAAERRLLITHPGRRRKVGLMHPSEQLRRRSQAWEVQQSTGTTRTAVTDASLERYLYEIAVGRVDDSAAIREWVTAAHDVEVGNRGRLRPDAVRIFCRDFLPLDLEPVKEWLAGEGRRLPPRGAVRQAAIDDYANTVHRLSH